MKVYIVIRSDGVITEVFDSAEAADNFCIRVNGSIHASYEVCYEEHEVLSSDGISDYIDGRKV